MSAFSRRWEQVRNAMREQGFGALIATPGAAMQYLSGFTSQAHERLLCLVLPIERAALFITPALNAVQAGANPAGIDDIRSWSDGSGWEPITRDMAVSLDLAGQTIAVDDDMPARFLLGLQEILPSAKFARASALLGTARLVKDSEEIAALWQAAQITDNATPAAFAACALGASELEVQMAIENAIYRQGAPLSFPPIVGAGENGAQPHHHTGTRKLAPGDVTVLDFGAKAHGYCGDITRTVAIGSASEEARNVYAIVYEAHQAALSQARAGVSAASVDAAARGVIERAGYGEYFIHRTGHGIGLDEHEEPAIVAGNQQILAPGMCFSIEPGIYLPGRFGVRLENIATIAEDGSCLSLNAPIPPALPIVGTKETQP